MPSLVRRLASTRLRPALLAAVLLLAALAGPTAGAEPGPVSPAFERLVREASVVAIADVVRVDPAGTIQVEIARVVKGTPTLRRLTIGSAAAPAGPVLPAGIGVGDHVFLAVRDAAHPSAKDTAIWLVARGGRLETAWGGVEADHLSGLLAGVRSVLPADELAPYLDGPRPLDMLMIVGAGSGAVALGLSALAWRAGRMPAPIARRLAGLGLPAPTTA